MSLKGPLISLVASLLHAAERLGHVMGGEESLHLFQPT